MNPVTAFYWLADAVIAMIALALLVFVVTLIVDLFR